jgi:hypothetical protein
VGGVAVGRFDADGDLLWSRLYGGAAGLDDTSGSGG